MSHRAAKVRPLSARMELFRVVLGLVLAAGGVFLVGLARGGTPTADWPRAAGRMVESRVVVDGWRVPGWASPDRAVRYRLEARVEFEADGVRRTEWLPTRERADSREWLMFRLSQRRSDTVVVAWDPKDAAKGLVKLDRR